MGHQSPTVTTNGKLSISALSQAADAFSGNSKIASKSSSSVIGSDTGNTNDVSYASSDVIDDSGMDHHPAVVTTNDELTISALSPTQTKHKDKKKMRRQISLFIFLVNVE